MAPPLFSGAALAPRASAAPQAVPSRHRWREKKKRRRCVGNGAAWQWVGRHFFSGAGAGGTAAGGVALPASVAAVASAALSKRDFFT